MNSENDIICNYDGKFNVIVLFINFHGKNLRQYQNGFGGKYTCNCAS